MNFLENIKSFSYDNVSLKENDYTLINLDNNIISYKNTDKSDNDILNDLLECKAYATALLYLNENYILEVGKFKDIFTESGITVEDYYSKCNNLLNKNIKIVEEIGIPLTEINGYKIFEGAGYILRGNGKKKIKESFEDEDKIIFDYKSNNKWCKISKTDLKQILSDDRNEAKGTADFDKVDDAFLKCCNNEPFSYKGIIYDPTEYRLSESGEEDGTQASDIAPKVDQNMNKNVTTSKKKHYDILLSGLDEGLNILNKGFLKNAKGQYQRGDYILVKEGEKYLAIHKDKLK